MFNIQFEIFIFIADYKDVTPDNPASDIPAWPRGDGGAEERSRGIEPSVAILPQK